MTCKKCNHCNCGANNISILREILGYIKIIYSIENEKLSYTQLKRMVYGIWNNGCNEKGEDIFKTLKSPQAKVLYTEMVNNFQKNKKIKIIF